MDNSYLNGASYNIIYKKGEKMLKKILFLLLANVLFVMNLSAVQEMIIPKALKPGDTIGLIAPAKL